MTDNNPMSHALKLAEALEPFAEVAREIDSEGWAQDDDEDLWALDETLTLGHVRRAREALTAYHASEIKDSELVPGEDETAWLIEETWSGFVHYVHKDFNCATWAAENRKNDASRRNGMPPRYPAILITKNVKEAMRFQTKEAAELWQAMQPLWMRVTDQYQIREHVWSTPIKPLAEGELPTAGSNEWWTVRRVANGDATRPWYELTNEDRAALGIAPAVLREALACLWIPTAEQIDPASYARIAAARKMLSEALGQTPRPLLFCREDEDPVEYRALVDKIRCEVDAEIAAEAEPLPDIREALGIPPCDPDIEKRFGPPTYTAEQVTAYARLCRSTQPSRSQGEEGPSS